MRYACASLLVVALSIVRGPAFAQQPNPYPGVRTIDVIGHADIKTRPDTMDVSFSVTAEGDSAEACTTELARKTSAVIAALKSATDPDAKVNTSDFFLNPLYRQVTPAVAPPTPAAIGPWQFKAQLTVEAPKIEAVGTIIQAAIDAGAAATSDTRIERLPEDESYYFGRSTAQSAMNVTVPNKQPRLKDIINVDLNVEALGNTPEECVQHGTALIDRVQKAITAKLGSPVKSQVTQLQVNPVQRTQSMPAYVPPPPMQQEQHGFSVRNNVTVETRRLDKLGGTVSAGMKAGAQALNSVTFTVGSDSDARKAAIAKASEEAKSKAASVAASMGVGLGRILKISTNAMVRPEVVNGQAYSGMVMHQMQQAEMPVIPREIGFGADVSVTYEIQ